MNLFVELHKVWFCGRQTNVSPLDILLFYIADGNMDVASLATSFCISAISFSKYIFFLFTGESQQNGDDCSYSYISEYFLF